jgi:hypothetical protein
MLTRPRPSRRAALLAAALVIAALLAGCGAFGRPPAATPTPVAEAQRITITAPSPNSTVSSPIAVSGATTITPFESNLNYRLFGPDGASLAQGFFTTQGEIGGPATFSGQIPYTLAEQGVGRLEVIEFSAADGSIRAINSIQITLSPGHAPAPTASITFNLPPNGGPIGLEIFEPGAAGQPVVASVTLQLSVAPPTNTPLPSSQAITIDTPPANTVVGSPVVITGRTALPPRTGRLFYVVRTLSREQLGQGEFPVAGNAAANVPFVASISFAEPAQGGGIVVEIYDRDAVGNQLASAFVQLRVNPRTPPTPTPDSGGAGERQQVFIDTPPPGVVVGSPVVITGRVTRPPVGGELDYRVTDAQGNVIGEGVFRVPIPADAPQIPYVVSIVFTEPAAGGPIRVTIADIDNGTGAVRAEASVDLTVNPRPYPLPAPRTP